MSVSKLIGSAQIYIKDGKISSIEDIEYNDIGLKSSKILSDVIKSIFPKGSFDQDGALWLQVLDNKDVKLTQGALVEELNKTISLPLKTAEKITEAFEYHIKANPTPKDNIIKNRYIKNVVNGADWVFRQKIYHAKLADITTIALFAFTILAIVVSISTQSTHALDIVKHLKVTQVVFGGLNITVGGVLFGQSIMNFEKARKAQDKKEMTKAVVQALLSVVVATVGATAIISFYKNVSPYLLKSLFFSCAAGLFYIGANNFKEIQKLKKLLKTMDFKDFLTKMLQIADDEKKEIKAKLKNLNDGDIDKWLKKIITNEQYLLVKDLDLKLKKKLIIEKEMAMLEERKKAHFDAYLGKQLREESLDLLKKSNISEKETAELKTKIEEAIQLRIKAEIARLIAPILGITAFGISVAHFNNKTIQDLIYNSLMLVACSFSAPLNYKKNTRNVPVEEKVKEHQKNTLHNEKEPLLST
ncbi:MAG: hypothetical protein KR126chlam6_00672 [Candidatus Anoxychlamydiales bacterium]|nr:hypothetical protein [Candidatus Anoxychlamydiales bacterium]